jgi:hypothetical protein
MAGDSDSGVSVPAAASTDDIILEGCLLKQGTRSARQWNDRYFVLTSNNMLAYYSQSKEEDKPKFVYPVSKEAGCHLSDVFEEHRSVKSHQGSSRETIYCVKLTWSIPIKRIVDDTWEESSLTGEAGPETFQQHYRRSSSPATIPTNGNGAAFSRRRTSSPVPKGASAGQMSWSSERRLVVSEVNDLSVSPRQRPLPRTDHDVTPTRTEDFSRSRGISQRFRIKPTKSEDDNDSLDLPNLEERSVAPTSVTKKVDVKLDEDETGFLNGGRSLEDEQKALHTTYLAKKKQNKKRNKKKVVDGAKIILAAGAFVGLGK